MMEWNGGMDWTGMVEWNGMKCGKQQSTRCMRKYSYTIFCPHSMPMMNQRTAVIYQILHVRQLLKFSGYWEREMGLGDWSTPLCPGHEVTAGINVIASYFTPVGSTVK